MRLAIVFTGGTICSELSDGYLSPAVKTKSNLIKALDSDIEVESFQPYYALSEQLNGLYISKLIKCVNERLSENFDGIIITHGTDTLQYSAAALSIAFGACKIPVVFVSANYILSDKRSNGISNFKYAVKFIREKIGGVFVSYKNENSNPEIYTADSLLAHNAYSDRLSSFSSPFGYFKDEEFIKLNKNYNPESEGAFTLSEKSPVLFIKAYPGMSYPDLSDYKAVLIETYHSGTLPTEDREFVDFCENSAIPIYLTGVSDEVLYESAKIYEQLNVVVLKKSSPIYAYISLWKQF